MNVVTRVGRTHKRAICMIHKIRMNEVVTLFLKGSKEYLQIYFKLMDIYTS